MMAQRDAIGSKIIFVSSFLALTSFVGYSPYSPGKYALRGEFGRRKTATPSTLTSQYTGLADTLRSELILYGIKVHLYCPAGILSPHFVTENETKPDITKKIEEGDTAISPERSAEYLLEGLDKGYYTITNDLVTDFMRVAACGTVPGNNLVYDRFLRGIAGVSRKVCSSFLR
jgi:3-dehydrosphinganine reductase